MKKLKLEIENLRVESFTTGAGRNPDGTVRAHADAFRAGEAELGGAEREIGEAAVITFPVTVTIPISAAMSCWGTCYASCPLGCTDGCTAYTCASGGDICCA
ncbi:MAG TPA: hypothetical protein VFR81_25990 [Longimicrobium sp.]|nr:hypothetical protein [Longimicrobium sp.]